MNPRLMRPLAAGNRLPVFAAAGYTRLWAVTTQSGGNITGSAETDTGYYAVKWWDNTVDIYESGDPFSKAALGNQRAFEVYPCDIAGVPGGQFDGFDLSDNSLTQVRSEGVTLATSGGAQTGGYFYSGYWFQGWFWGPYFSPIVLENGIVSDNLLSSAALDQFYTDLDAGTGSLFVDGNPGIDADDPTIATAKGYAVFGSVPPGTALLLNFNGTNGSTTFTDSSPNGLAVTANGDAQISTAQSKFGGASGYFDGSGDYISLPYSSDFSPAGKALTIECWLRPAATQVGSPGGNGNAGAIFSFRNGPVPAGLEFSIRNNLKLTILANTTFNDWYLPVPISNTALVADEWAHVALVRNTAGQTTLYINGVADSAITALNIPYQANSGDAIVYIGVGGDGYFNGYIDDLRVVKDAALYTANFTPPTSELEVYP
jgi:hypothetical protein